MRKRCCLAALLVTNYCTAQMPGVEFRPSGRTMEGWSPVGAYAVEGDTARVESRSGQDQAGLMRVVNCDPPINEPFTASARAKAENVGGGGDFAVWLDLIHTDGSPTWGQMAGFSRGTHDWQTASVDIVPAKPVAAIRFHLLLRHTTGKAWFAEPKLAFTPLSFTRLEVISGLWNPESLTIRAETNLPAEIHLAGLTTTSRPAGVSDHSFTLDLDRPAFGMSADRMEIIARATRRPSNSVRKRLHPEAASPASGPVRAWVTHAMDRIYTDTLPPFSTGQPLAVDVARAGHVSIQIGLAAGRDVQGLQVRAADLATADGVRLPAEIWQRFRVGFIRAEQPARHPCLERYGGTWWPDALLPYQPLRVPAGQSRSVILTARIPESQPPGLYEGSVTVSGEGISIKLPVRIRVHPFVVPARLRMKTAFALMDGFLEKMYGPLTPEMRRTYNAFVLDHRLNPDDISRTRLPDLDELTWAKDRGLNAFNILNLVPEPANKVTWVCFAETKDYTPAFKQRLIERLDAYVPELEKRGLLEYAYIYGFDERGKEYIPIMQEYFGLIKQRYPKVRTLSTCWPPDGTDPASLHIDWYCPLSNKYDPELAAKARARGGEMWWYICMGPTWPYANWLFEYPLVEARLVWWQAWQNRVDGFLYWGLNIWDRPGNDAPIADDAGPLLAWTTTPFEPLHGDGVLMYPGQHGPIGSLRLLNIRDGLEDTAILEAAATKLGRGRVEQISRKVSRGMTEFSRDPAALNAARAELLAAVK